MVRQALVGLVLAAALLLSVTARADVVIYDNGTPDLGNAWLSDFDRLEGGYQICDDFVLEEGSSTITDVHWWGVYAFENTPSEVDDFTIRIFEQGDGMPEATPWWESNVGSVTRTEVGLVGDYWRLFEYSVYIDPVTVNAGQTYYLSIVNNTVSDTDDNWFWAESSNWGDCFARWGDDGYWSSPGVEMAFHLTGGVVPEPATLSLLGLGLAAMGVRRLRRRAA